MDTFCHYLVTTNTQGENANAILTIERINNSDALVEMLKRLKINNAGYYNSDKNDTERDPESIQQKLLINRTLSIITMPIDSRIPAQC